MSHRIMWACWIVGVALIGLSRMNMVSNDVGWAGFWIAAGAAVWGQLRRGTQASQPECKFLTRSMIARKDHGYRTAVEHFLAGGDVMFDGIVFSVVPQQSWTLLVATSALPAEFDEQQALKDANRATLEFEELARDAREFGESVAGLQQVVFVMSEFGDNGRYLCRVSNGQVDWQIPPT